MGVWAAFGMAAKRWYLLIPLIMVTLGVSWFAYAQMPASYSGTIIYEVNAPVAEPVTRPSTRTQGLTLAPEPVPSRPSVQSLAAELMASVRLTRPAGTVTGRTGDEPPTAKLRARGSSEITVRATANSVTGVQIAISSATIQLRQLLAEIQDERGESPDSRASLGLSRQLAVSDPVRTVGVRVFVATLTFGLLLSIVLAAAVERSARRRRALVTAAAGAPDLIDEPIEAEEMTAERSVAAEPPAPAAQPAAARPAAEKPAAEKPTVAEPPTVAEQSSPVRRPELESAPAPGDRPKRPVPERPSLPRRGSVHPSAPAAAARVRPAPPAAVVPPPGVVQSTRTPRGSVPPAGPPPVPLVRPTSPSIRSPVPPGRIPRPLGHPAAQPRPNTQPRPNMGPGPNTQPRPTTGQPRPNMQPRPTPETTANGMPPATAIQAARRPAGGGPAPPDAAVPDAAAPEVPVPEVPVPEVPEPEAAGITRLRPKTTNVSAARLAMSELADRLRLVSRFSGPDPATFASSELWDPITEPPPDSDRWLPTSPDHGVPSAPRTPGAPGVAATPDPAAAAGRPSKDQMEGWPDFDEPARV